MANTPKLLAEITDLFVGEVEELWPGKASSAINKKLTNKVLRLEINGFTKDNQADHKVHGGTEKAVHHYASEHMEHWKKQFPDQAEKFIPGCFGENISTIGLHENNLCLGDILEMGSSTVQICQGRQPCWKLNLHTGIPAMAAAFQKTARTGWYYRVIQTGDVRTGDIIHLIERQYPKWTLDRLIKARFNPKLSTAEALELSQSPVISKNWQKAFQRKQSCDYKENTDARLKG